MADENLTSTTSNLHGHEPVAIIPSTTILANANNDLQEPIASNGHAHHAFDESYEFDAAHDSLDHIELEHTVQTIPSSKPSTSSRENTKTRKSGANILQFERGNAEDPWKADGAELTDADSVINADYQPPCPWISNRLPYCCILCCCCFWSTFDRQQCSLALLYTKFYLSIYVLSIVITLALLIYDLSNGSIANERLDKEPLWFISLDIFCVGLMVFDIVVQIQASNYKKYFKSVFNVFDFVIVVVCVVSIPVYWFAPDWILSIVLLSRFIVRMLRIITVIRAQKVRNDYLKARDEIVDFTKFNEQNKVKQRANDTNEQFL